jgi:hypothetical protein
VPPALRIHLRLSRNPRCRVDSSLALPPPVCSLGVVANRPFAAVAPWERGNGALLQHLDERRLRVLSTLPVGPNLNVGGTPVALNWVSDPGTGGCDCGGGFGRTCGRECPGPLLKLVRAAYDASKATDAFSTLQNCRYCANVACGLNTVGSKVPRTGSVGVPLRYETEWATGVLFRSPAALAAIYPRLGAAIKFARSSPGRCTRIV